MGWQPCGCLVVWLSGCLAVCVLPPSICCPSRSLTRLLTGAGSTVRVSLEARRAASRSLRQTKRILRTWTPARLAAVPRAERKPATATEIAALLLQGASAIPTTTRARAAACTATQRQHATDTESVATRARASATQTTTRPATALPSATRKNRATATENAATRARANATGTTFRPILVNTQ